MPLKFSAFKSGSIPLRLIEVTWLAPAVLEMLPRRGPSYRRGPERRWRPGGSPVGTAAPGSARNADPGGRAAESRPTADNEVQVARIGRGAERVGLAGRGRQPEVAGRRGQSGRVAVRQQAVVARWPGDEESTIGVFGAIDRSLLLLVIVIRSPP